MHVRAPKLLGRFTYANVMSTFAVFLVLGGGTAYAANTVFSTDIVDGEVKTADLADNGVDDGEDRQQPGLLRRHARRHCSQRGGPHDSLTSPDLAANSVTGSEIAPDAVNSSKVLVESLTSADLATSSVTSSEIASDAVGATEVAESAIDSGEIDDNSLLATDLATGSVSTDEILNGGIANVRPHQQCGQQRQGRQQLPHRSDIAANTLTTADIAGTDINPGVISLGAGEVANGRCRQFSIGVGGAKAGEGVILSTKAALQDGILIYAQRVPSDGTVTIDICNLSGTTQAAITDFPIRVITFG